MARRNMKGALEVSMRAEADAVRDRFEVAESVMAGRQPLAAGQPLAAPAPLAARPSPTERQAPPKQASRKPRPREAGHGEAQSSEQPLTKVVRDSFTMPANDYELITAIRSRCLKWGTSVTKAEVLRAALSALSALPDEELLEVIKGLPKVKTGRPTATADTV